MKHGGRRHKAKEEEESAFVSMTDMTVSFLFIIIILLAYFASSFGTKETDMVLRTIYDEVVKQRDDYRTERDAARATVREREAEITRLRVLLATLRHDLEIASSERDAALANVDRLQDLMARKEQRIASLQATVKQQGAKIDTLTRKNTVLQAELDDARVTIAAQIAKIKELEARNKQKDQKIVRLEAEIARLNDLIAQQEKELEDLRRKNRDPLENYLADVARARQKILTELKRKLKIDFPDLQVEISERHDALRFKGEGFFAPESYDLLHDKKIVMESVAELLDKTLPCYTLGATTNWQESCNPGFAVIDAIQIEGHADSQGDEIYNLRLSNDRAVSAFKAMIRKAPTLIEHRNYRNQPVISVAGYGEYRPIASNDARVGKARNRRIELRILMFAPASTAQIGKLKEQLLQAGSGE